MDCLHAPWQFSRLQLEHMHPFAHDEVIVRIDCAVRLVFYERHEGGQGGAGFVLRRGRRRGIVGSVGTCADGGIRVAGIGGYAGRGRHGQGGWVRSG